jgi:CRISPR-associated protein Cas2
MLIYIVTYDIACNKRRRKVSDLLEGYGERVQESVFECMLQGDHYRELRRRLKKHINESEDSVRFYPISRHTLAQVEIWGGVPLITPPGSIIV